MAEVEEEAKNDNWKGFLKDVIFMVKCCGGFSQQDFRKSKFANKTFFQTEGQMKNDRHILYLDLVATIVNLSQIMEKCVPLPPENVSNIRDCVMDGSLNLVHSSRRANVGETTTWSDGSVHPASEKVSDLSACTKVLDSLWSGKHVELTSLEASHVRAQIEVLKSDKFRSAFSSTLGYATDCMVSEDYRKCV